MNRASRRFLGIRMTARHLGGGHMNIQDKIIRAGLLALTVVAPTLALTSALAQQPLAPPGAEVKPPPAAAPAEEPRWMQGRPSEMKSSTLAPIAPHLTGRAAKDL